MMDLASPLSRKPSVLIIPDGIFSIMIFIALLQAQARLMYWRFAGLRLAAQHWHLAWRMASTATF
jgi:hypothetical protein